jgi:SPP1 gp7 family putative phage head morphogenesis protein
MGKTSKYWDDRAIKRLTGAEKTSEQYIKQVQKMYDRAYRNINKEIETIYKSYSNDTGIDVNTLKQLLTKKETSKVFKELKAKGYDKYIKDNYKSRITRLEQLKAQIYAKAKDVYSEEELISHKCYGEVYKNSYYRSIYDTQMGTGLDFGFSTIDNNLIETLLNERWSGKNYKQRIWGNTDILAESVSEIVGGAILSGQSLSKTTQQIRERFGVCKYYAERLVRTETNHFYNEADALAYEEMGIDKYVFVAVLDSRTSPMCQSYDNKVLDYKDKKVGVNFPPLHPNCRSTTRGYLGEEAEKSLQRRARDPKTGKTELINNMSYKEWAKSKGLEDSKTKRGGQLPAKPVVDTPKSVKTTPKTTDFSEILKKNLNKIEYSNRNLKYEVGTVLDTKGNILATYEGKDHEVDVGDKSLLKGNIFTHNHPTGGTFSEGDIDSFIKYDLQELRASTDTEVYSLAKVGTNQDPNFYKEFKSHSYEFYSKATAEINELIRDNKLDFNPREKPAEYMKLVSKYKAKYYDEWLTQNASNYGYKYTKELLTELDTVKEATKDVFTTENLPAWFKDYKGNVDTEGKYLTEWLNKNGNPNSKASKVFSNSIKDMGLAKGNTDRQTFITYKDNKGEFKRELYFNTIEAPKLSDKQDPRGSIQIMLHENWHAIDYNKGTGGKYVSTMSDKLRAVVRSDDNIIGEDMSKLFKEYNDKCKEISTKISKDNQYLFTEINKKWDDGKYGSYSSYKSAWSKARSKIRSLIDYEERNLMGGGMGNLQDIYDALSGGRFRDTGVVKYGHGGKYYRRGGYDSRLKEIIANYGALSMTRPDLIEMLKADKPALVQELEALLDSML